MPNDIKTCFNRIRSHIKLIVLSSSLVHKYHNISYIIKVVAVVVVVVVVVVIIVVIVQTI